MKLCRLALSKIIFGGTVVCGTIELTKTIRCSKNLPNQKPPRRWHCPFFSFTRKTEIRQGQKGTKETEGRKGTKKGQKGRKRGREDKNRKWIRAFGDNTR